MSIGCPWYLIVSSYIDGSLSEWRELSDIFMFTSVIPTVSSNLCLKCLAKSISPSADRWKIWSDTVNECLSKYEKRTLPIRYTFPYSFMPTPLHHLHTCVYLTDHLTEWYHFGWRTVCSIRYELWLCHPLHWYCFNLDPRIVLFLGIIGFETLSRPNSIV